MQVIHRFLRWFPLRALGVLFGFVGLAIAAAQVWPKVKEWDEAKRDFVLHAIKQPASWLAAGIVLITWLYLVWLTRPEKRSAASKGPKESITLLGYGLDRVKIDWTGNHRPLERKTFVRPSTPARHPGLEHAKQEFWGRRREPARDVSLSEGLAYAEFGEWNRTFFDAASTNGNKVNENLDIFRQKAHEGLLLVWGKRSTGRVFQKIPQDHWIDHHVEWFDLLRGAARTEPIDQGGADNFIEVMVCKAEFEREWPLS